MIYPRWVSLQEMLLQASSCVPFCCSAAGVPVLVDGAHSVGSLYDLKVPELGCSYFVSTLHKWLCTPKVRGGLQTITDAQVLQQQQLL
jgi:isopenicillin-N epimerase